MTAKISFTLYNLYHIHFTSFTSYNGDNLNSQLTCFRRGFIAQSVEHRTGIAEVMGSNPVGASEFFLGFLCNFLSYFTTAKITFTCMHSWSLLYTYERLFWLTSGIPLQNFTTAKAETATTTRQNAMGSCIPAQPTSFLGKGKALGTRLPHNTPYHLTNWHNIDWDCWDTLPLTRTSVTADLDPYKNVPNSGSRTRNKCELTHQFTFWNGDIHCAPIFSCNAK